MSFSAFGLIVAGWLLPLTAQATGFGAPQDEPVIGMPLSVEIEVINPEYSSLECFEIKPVDEAGENDFFPRHVHLDLKKTAGGKTHLVVRSSTIVEPIVEFRLRTRCGTEVERRYTLLAAPPPELQPAAVTLPIAPPSATTAAPTAGTTATSRPSVSLTLNQLARQRYPLQPKAREKFKRLVKNANPDLQLADDEALPVDPASLKYPDNLPQRRTGPYRPLRTKQKSAAAQKKPPVKAPASAPTPTPKLVSPEPVPQSDRLVIAPGAGEKPQAALAQESSALAAKAESSFAAQQEMTARLEQAELAYKGLQERLQLMEDRMRGLEMEKQRLQREHEALSQSALVELVLAVVAGGALGALLMSLWLRRRATSGIDL